MSDDPRTAKVGETWRCTHTFTDGSTGVLTGVVQGVHPAKLGLGKVGSFILDDPSRTWEKLADAPAPEPVVGQIYVATVCGVEDVPVRWADDSAIPWMLLLAEECASCGFSWHASKDITDWRPASVIETAELERLRGELS